MFLLYRGGQFYWQRRPEYPEKTTDLSLVIDREDQEYLEKSTDLSLVIDREDQEYLEKTTDLR